MSTSEVLPQAIAYRPICLEPTDPELLSQFVQKEEMNGSRWLGRVLSIVVNSVGPSEKPPRAIIEFSDVTEDVGVQSRCVSMPLDVLRSGGVVVESLEADQGFILDSCTEPPRLYEAPPAGEAADATELAAAANAWGSVSIKTA